MNESTSDPMSASPVPPTDRSSAGSPRAARPRARWKSIALALVIFAGGAACGAAAVTHLFARGIHHALVHPEDLPEHFTRRMARFLDLDEAQTKQVREIVARRQGALTAIRVDVQPRLEVEVETLEREMDAVLNDEQRRRFHAHVAEMRAIWFPPLPSSSAPAPAK